MPQVFLSFFWRYTLGVAEAQGVTSLLIAVGLLKGKIVWIFSPGCYVA